MDATIVLYVIDVIQGSNVTRVNYFVNENYRKNIDHQVDLAVKRCGLN